jgi:Asp-tRNA(Asn)/Glu-tRNA(Gln) amidotransferase A subunit family amidase
LLLSVWAGPDERDPLSLPARPNDYIASLRLQSTNVRVAYSPDLGIGVEEEVDEVVRTAVARLESLGCDVDEVEFEQGDVAAAAWTTWYRTSLSASYGRYVQDHRHEMARYVVDSIEKGAQISANEFLSTQSARSRYYDQVRKLLERYDFLVSPTLRRVPPTADRISAGPDYVAGRQADPIIGWSLTWPFNLTTHPSASIPVGFTPAGLPVGMQIVGRRFADEEVLALSALIEEDAPWHSRRPQLVPAANGEA